jgi:hypothetical protein
MVKKKKKISKKKKEEKISPKKEDSELEEVIEKIEESEEVINPNQITEFLQPSTQSSNVVLQQTTGSQETPTNIEEQLVQDTTASKPTTSENQPTYLAPSQEEQANYEAQRKADIWTTGGTISVRTEATPIENLRTDTQQELRRTVGQTETSSVWAGVPREDEKYFANVENTQVDQLGKEKPEERKEIKYRPKY